MYRGDVGGSLSALPVFRRYSTYMRRDVGVAVGLHKRVCTTGKCSKVYYSKILLPPVRVFCNSEDM